MNKKKIQINELNKLYDEIYYSNLDDIEYSLDIITNLISEKEFEDIDSEISGISSIIEVIIEVLEEVAEAFSNEDLMDAYNYTREKIDKIQSGELDERIELEYDRFDENLDDDFIDEDFDSDMDEYEEEYEDDEYYDY